MSRVSKHNKVMSVKEAVEKFVFDGAIIGMGGQNVSRCAVSIAHEIIRQGKRGLVLTGCNLSIHMDLMVGAGLVRKCELGLAGLGRFGATSDILKYQGPSTGKKFEVIDNPWNRGERIVLVPAMQPDVSIVHVQKADEIGNTIIQGIASHEPELIRASNTTIVSCEEIVSTSFFRSHSDYTTIPYHYIDAVIEQPFGAYPTSTYGYYTFDADHIGSYQEYARAGGEEYMKYMDEYVYGCKTFSDFLEKSGGIKKLNQLRKEMLRLM